MKIIKKVLNKNYWISIGIIVLSVMLFTSLVSSLITKYTGIGDGIILDFFSLTVIVFLSKIISEEILEVNI